MTFLWGSTPRTETTLECCSHCVLPHKKKWRRNAILLVMLHSKGGARIFWDLSHLTPSTSRSMQYRCTGTGQCGPAYVSMGQHGSAWVNMGQHRSAWASMGQHGPGTSMQYRCTSNQKGYCVRILKGYCVSILTPTSNVAWCASRCS